MGVNWFLISKQNIIMATQTYLLTAFTNAVAITGGYVDTQRLSNEVLAALPTPLVLTIIKSSTNVIFTFASALTAGQITTLTAVVVAHPNNAIAAPQVFASTNPLTTNDELTGTNAYDEWINVGSRYLWKCLNGYENAANWQNLSKLIIDFQTSTSSTATTLAVPANGSATAPITTLGTTSTINATTNTVAYASLNYLLFLTSNITTSATTVGSAAILSFTFNGVEDTASRTSRLIRDTDHLDQATIVYYKTGVATGTVIGLNFRGSKNTAAAATITLNSQTDLDPQAPAAPVSNRIFYAFGFLP